jgi:RNA polymerase-binding transcription factor DksA
MSCTKVQPYFSVDRPDYHVCSNCTVGNNIERDKLQVGNPGTRSLCIRCQQIIAGTVTR